MPLLELTTDQIDMQRFLRPHDKPNPEVPVYDDKVCPECSSTLVHTIETSSRFNRGDSHRDTIDEFNSATYSRIQAAYRLLDEEDTTRREEQLLNCQTFAWFFRHKETGEVKVIGRKCGLRWCPVCQQSRQARITHEVSNWLKMFKHPKILTLTLLHSTDTLNEQIKRLYDCFRKLRSRKFFKSKVTGGVWFFQIKKSKTDGLWHPHLHCLITGMFVPRDKLSKLWLEITGDSPVCDIRAVKDPDTAVRHVARYAASPADLSNLSQIEIAEIIQSMHGRRIFGTWGKARSISFKNPKSSESESWVQIGSWSAVFDMRDVDPDAKLIFNCWTHSQPLPASVTMRRIDQLLSVEGAPNPPPATTPYLTNFYGVE